MEILSPTISLLPIHLCDQKKLINLIHRIYPPSYKHLWVNQDCNWYANKFFNKENLKFELEDENGAYYFIVYNNITTGILRIVYNREYDMFPEKKATYLHRIYLGQESQGKGVAKQIFDWAEKKAIEKGSEIMWLKAMDTQEQALKFYLKQGYEISGETRLEFNLIHEKYRGMKLFHKIL